MFKLATFVTMALVSSQQVLGSTIPADKRSQPSETPGIFLANCQQANGNWISQISYYDSIWGETAQHPNDIATTIDGKVMNSEVTWEGVGHEGFFQDT